MRFATAARANAEAEAWDPAVANAINAVINCVDALCVYYQGLRSASGSHQDSLRVLDGCRELLPPTRDGIRKHLVALLSQKTFAQYDSRLMGEHDAEAAISHMERAVSLAEPVARSGGWLA